MQRASAEFPPLNRRRRGPLSAGRDSRRGVMTAWSLIGFLMAALCLALALNHAWVSSVRNDALRSAEASALAAGHAYLQDDLLRMQQAAFEADGRIVRSRHAALQMSDQYRRTCTLPALTETEIIPLAANGTPLSASSETASSSFLTTVSQSSPGGTSGSSPSAAPIPDSFLVRYGSGTAHRVPLFLSGLTGVRSATLNVGAVARLEHTPAGFSVSGTHTIPLLPLTTPDDPNAVVPSSWSSLIDAQRGPDRLTWNAVERRAEAGADGIPEMELTLRSDRGTPQNGELTAFVMPGCTVGSDTWVRTAEQGMSAPDLAGLSRTSAVLQFPQTCSPVSLSTTDLRSLSDALWQIRGEPRILCLADTADAASLRLTRPVALRILDVRSEGTTAVRIVVQPCILRTSLAVTDTSGTTPANRYVWSVRLTH